ncbi:MAG: hypothetical protein ACQEQM_02890 [Thermoplasmatota archaeon]
MTNKAEDLKEEMEEKLMEAKVFLSEARFTNINVNGVKDKIRKAVDMRKKQDHEASIKYSEKAIEQANIILDMYEKLKSRKKKLIDLKKNGQKRDDIIEGLKTVKKLTDDGEYKKANEKLKKVSLKIDNRFEEIGKMDEGEIEIEKEIVSTIPEDGITVYSLKNELDDVDEEELREFIQSLEDRGYVELEKKGRWDVVNVTGNEYPEKEVKVSEGKAESEQEDESSDDSINSEVYFEIPLDEKEYEVLNNIWEDIFICNMDDELVDMLGWNDEENFYRDILFYSIHELKKAPTQLIQDKILSEFKYLKDDNSEELMVREFKKELDNLER